MQFLRCVALSFLQNAENTPYYRLKFKLKVFRLNFTIDFPKKCVRLKFNLIRFKKICFGAINTRTKPAGPGGAEGSYARLKHVEKLPKSSSISKKIYIMGRFHPQKSNEETIFIASQSCNFLSPNERFNERPVINFCSNI